MNESHSGAITNSFLDANATRDVHNDLFSGIFRAHLETWIEHLGRPAATAADTRVLRGLQAAGKLWA